MDKKILIIIGIIAIVVVAIGAAVVALSVFEETTEVDNKFIKATIPGIAIENDVSNSLTGDKLLDWATEYEDNGNGVLYEFAMFRSFNFTEDMIVNVFNVNKLATKDYNGNKWNIYYLDTNSLKNSSVNIGISSFYTGAGYFCFASGKTGDYMVIVGSDSTNSDNIFRFWSF